MNSPDQSHALLCSTNVQRLSPLSKGCSCEHLLKSWAFESARKIIRLYGDKQEHVAWVLLGYHSLAVGTTALCKSI